MTRPKPSLRSLAELHPAGDGAVEDCSTWRYAGPVRDGEVEAIRDAWEAVSGSGWTIEVKDGEYEPVPIASVLEGQVPDSLNIRITKPPAGPTTFFLQPEAALRCWDEVRIATSTSVRVMGNFRPFRAGGRWISDWDGSAHVAEPEVAAVDASSDAVPDIRRGLVRDLSGGRMPGDLLRWVPSAPLDGHAFHSSFTREASARLMLALASEVEVDEEGVLRVVLNGLRKRSFRASPPSECSPAQFEALREVVEWLLVPARDAEARHQMLVRRLEPLIADERTGDWWGAVSPHLKEALSGARTEYRVFVTSKSADLLKTMTEVRKGVAEDVDRIVARTNRMSQAFSGALAVLAAGLGVRIATLASSSTGAVSTFVFCGVVLFATWSGVRLNELVATRSLVADLRHLRRWHFRLHQNLTRAEHRSMAVLPVLEAVKLFNETRRRTRQAFRVAAWIFGLLVTLAPLVRDV